MDYQSQIDTLKNVVHNLRQQIAAMKESGIAVVAKAGELIFDPEDERIAIAPIEYEVAIDGRVPRIVYDTKSRKYVVKDTENSCILVFDGYWFDGLVHISHTGFDSAEDAAEFITILAGKRIRNA